MNELNKKTIFEWDHLNWSRALNFWHLPELKSQLKEDRALLLGERSGGLSLYVASLGIHATCSDHAGISPEVQSVHQQYLFSNKVTYKAVSIFDIPYSNASFDFVLIKSVIGGLKLDIKDKSTRTLENQKLAIEEVLRVLKPGGYYLGAENMVGSKLIQWIRRRYRKGNIGWRHFKTEELEALLIGFSNVEIEYFGVIPGNFRFQVLNSFVYFINRALNPLLPKNMKYIAFIKCQK